MAKGSGVYYLRQPPSACVYRTFLDVVVKQDHNHNKYPLRTNQLRHMNRRNDLLPFGSHWSVHTVVSTGVQLRLARELLA